ncbi:MULTISPECIES: hypothetical protein [Providencia]|uniref:hypothetical protein n=1 Tax=Providencia TaxID=586 RepID=UPI00141A3DAB|nr:MULTISPECIES: hypothetical protein [Providencia]ELR5145416.1 hypothetical protein [Providencia rettgeri]NIA43216.1 hypothetical protein [Providencia rettgeri]NIA96291.1 hypothetical protein [Providencia rettgeri]NIB14114.1 hypothetical protein [Providencia rettgeri]NIB33877.1 hypothetical protein [Providencia rettgeri]
MEQNLLLKVDEIKTFRSSFQSETENKINELLSTKEWILISCVGRTDRDDISYT